MSGSTPLVLENDLLRVTLQPGRGAEIAELASPGGSNALAWDDWVTPVPAEQSASYGRPDLDWLSGYRGGWQVLLPNAGAACVVDGVPLGFHGELSSAPWTVVESSPTHVDLRAGARLPLIATRRLSLDGERPVLRIEESVHNDGTRPVPFLWGHHPAFPARVGARLDLPAREVHVDGSAAGDLYPGSGTWPRLPGPAGDTDLSVVGGGRMERLCYLPALPAGWAAIRQPDNQPSVALAWDRETFPHLWCWQQLGGERFPWFGRARMLTLEPMSAWPADGLAEAVKRGRAHWLEPGAERRTWVTAALFADGGRAVVGVRRDGHICFDGGGADR